MNSLPSSEALPMCLPEESTQCVPPLAQGPVLYTPQDALAAFSPINAAMRKDLEIACVQERVRRRLLRIPESGVELNFWSHEGAVEYLSDPDDGYLPGRGACEESSDGSTRSERLEELLSESASCEGEKNEWTVESNEELEIRKFSGEKGVPLTLNKCSGSGGSLTRKHCKKPLKSRYVDFEAEVSGEAGCSDSDHLNSDSAYENDSFVCAEEEIDNAAGAVATAAAQAQQKEDAAVLQKLASRFLQHPHAKSATRVHSTHCSAAANMLSSPFDNDSSEELIESLEDDFLITEVDYTSGCAKGPGEACTGMGAQSSGRLKGAAGQADRFVGEAIISSDVIEDTRIFEEEDVLNTNEESRRLALGRLKETNEWKGFEFMK